MGFIDKSVEIEIPCPKCGHKTSKSIRWIEAHPEFLCEGKGCAVNIKAHDFIRKIKEADKSISDFERNLKNLKF